jgi:hypothetical protein
MGAIVVGLMATGVQADALVGYCWSRPVHRQVLSWSLVFGNLSAFLWVSYGLATASVPVFGRIAVSLIGIPVAAYIFLMPAWAAFDLAISRHSGARFSKAFELWEMFFELFTEGD